MYVSSVADDFTPCISLRPSSQLQHTTTIVVSHNFFTLIIFIGIMGAGTIIHYIVLSASESEDDPPFFAIPWAEKTHQEGVEISAGGSRSKSPHGPSLSRLAEIWGFLFEHMVPPKNLQV